MNSLNCMTQCTFLKLIHVLKLVESYSIFLRQKTANLCVMDVSILDSQHQFVMYNIYRCFRNSL